jgi:hypothetical protein
MDIPLDNHAFRNEVAGRLHKTAKGLGQPLIQLETNLRELTDPYMPWLYAFGAALTACGWILSAQHQAFIMSAAFNVEEFQEGQADLHEGSQPDLVEALSTRSVRITPFGSIDRIGKLKAIADLPVVQQHLRVCWENRGGAYNCGACDKCLRTMAALAALCKLDQFTCFERDLDFKRLSRTVPPYPVMNHFVLESIREARAHGADPRLIESLQTSLTSNTAWFWRLHSRHTPLSWKDWAFRMTRGRRPRNRGVQ